MNRKDAAGTARPLVLLDVDGVLNALPQEGHLPDAWEEWQIGDATADARSWPITFAPAAIKRIVSLHTTNAVELRWLTTWGEEANGGLRRLLGLPKLAVAGTYQDECDVAAACAEAARALASTTPAGPNAGHGWWKHDVLTRLTAAEPERLIVWIDDELHRPSRYTAWASTAGVLAIGPNPANGLAGADLLLLEEAVGLDQQERALIHQ